jgi:hypothetical protein
MLLQRIIKKLVSLILLGVFLLVASLLFIPLIAIAVGVIGSLFK